VVVQRASVPWLLQNAKVDGVYPFSANSIVVSSTFAEIILGVSLACFSMGSIRLGIKTALDWNQIKRWFILGISQALSDMLELYANKYMDGSTYQTLLQSKLMVTAIIITFTQKGVTQSSLEWTLLIALSLGLTTYSVLSTGGGAFPMFGTFLAVLKVVLSCVNAVCTERILKQSGEINIVCQIVHMKIFWCMWSLVFMVALEGPTVFAPSNFFAGWGPSVLLVIATYVIKNWSGTFLLKKLDSLLKNIAEAFAMLVLYLVELSPLLGGAKKFELPTFCVTMLVVLLVYAYMESKRAARSQATGKQTYLADLLERPLMIFENQDSHHWMEEGRRLGKRYGLLPSGSSSSNLRRIGSQNFKIVPNKNSSGNLAKTRTCDLPSMNSDSNPDLASLAKSRTCDLPPLTPIPDRKPKKSASEFPTLELQNEKYTTDAAHGFIENVSAHLRRALETIPKEASADPGVNAWKTEVKKALSLCSGLRPYLEVVNWRVSPECLEIDKVTREMDWVALHKRGETLHRYHVEMMATATQGQMLQFFCSMLNARRVLEVGMFTGYSSLFMAEALPSTGLVTSVEKDPYLVKLARKMFDKSPHGKKIDIREGDALEVFRNFGVAQDDEDRFDLIFIDGDKTQYADYFNAIQNQDLLAPGGLICIDDCLWKGAVYTAGENDNDSGSDRARQRSDSDQGSEHTDQQVADSMRRLNQAIATDPRLKTVLLPIRNGLALVRRDGEDGDDKDHFSGALQPRQQQQRQRTGLHLRQARAQRGRGASPGPPSHGTRPKVMSSPLCAESPAPVPEDGELEDYDLDEASNLQMTMDAQGIEDMRRLDDDGCSRQDTSSSMNSDASSLPLMQGLAARIQTC